MTFDQAEFDVRCEWGEQGVAQLAPISDVVVIVDVSSFSTCVEIAVSRGAIVFPYRWHDESARAFAQSLQAELATKRGGGYSLSPASLCAIPAGTRLVLPSPNGATLSLATGNVPTLVGCLRNRLAVAQAAPTYGPHIAVIPAGERWDDGSLRPAFEDLVGAGAIISQLPGALSPEARLAVAAWRAAENDLPHLLKQCSSGKELIERGYAQDVELAAQLDSSDCVPVLQQGAFVQWTGHL
jgi:2-phosphosulfolactate phosphatase